MDDELAIGHLAILFTGVSEALNFYDEILYKNIEKSLMRAYKYDEASAINKKVLTAKINKDLEEFKKYIQALKTKIFKIEKALIKNVDSDTVDFYIDKLFPALDTIYAESLTKTK
jgi:hypothetical protein